MGAKSVAIVGLLGLVLAGGLNTAQEKKVDQRDADRTAIKKMLAEFMVAFEKGDAKAVSSFWTADGEFINEDGIVLEGRKAIEKAYSAHLGEKQPGKLDLQIESIRFPSPDTAILDVTLRRKDGDEVISSSQSQSFLVRDGAQWKLAVVHEWERDSAIDTQLDDLAWLIGTWSATSKEKAVDIKYDWDEQKNFIKGTYTVKDNGKLVESGTQVIGKDNLHGLIRSWAFQADGGFGGGTWHRDGKRWLLDSAGVLADGRETTATYIYNPVDKDVFTWQAIDRTLGGEPVPNTEPIKVLRKK